MKAFEFDGAARWLRGESTPEEDAARLQRMEARYRARPQPCEVYPPALNENAIKLLPHWPEERVIAVPALYDGVCPCCEGEGLYLEEGRGLDGGLSPCHCQPLEGVVHKINALMLPVSLHGASPQDTDWASWGGDPVGTQQWVQRWADDASRRRGPHEAGARGWVFAGATGRGKSHLAALMAISCVVRGARVKWLSWPGLVAEAGRALKGGAGIAGMYDSLMRPYDVVVIDDVAKEGHGAPWLPDLVDGLIGRRAESRRTMIVTVNLGGDALAQFMGSRTTSRLNGAARTVPIEGGDRRVQP